MTTNDDGGSAFQTPRNVRGSGMSLRDWFAGQALMGMCAHTDTWGLMVPGLARKSYEVADAMLAARKEACP